jgi:signal transduction histidine kinase
MGIGLAMVNNLVIQAGGTISFATEQGKGTVFYLQLPLHPSWHTTQ